MATTEDALVDRVRAVLIETLGFQEAVGRDFSRTAIGATDKRFIVTFAGLPPMGGFAFNEEARGRIVVDVARATNNNSPEATRKLYQDARAVVRAIVRDAAEDSGEYAIEDTDRGVELIAPDGAAYQVVRVTVPVNFEATL
jgi:hypothetical protein